MCFVVEICFEATGQLPDLLYFMFMMSVAHISCSSACELILFDE
jgi:hypothetical protein